MLGAHSSPHPLPSAPWVHQALAWAGAGKSLPSPFHLLLPSWGGVNSLTPSAAAGAAIKHPTLLPAVALAWLVAPCLCPEVMWGVAAPTFLWGSLGFAMFCGLQKLEICDLHGLWKGRGGARRVFLLLSTNFSFGEEKQH